jgi:O-acetyl-ADP-ribose deacetylase (regulator of RNase III)
MPDWFERYQQGACQEVYDELIALGEAVYDEPIYREANLVAHAMMKRVHQNLAMLISRLHMLNIPRRS